MLLRGAVNPREPEISLSFRVIILPFSVNLQIDPFLFGKLRFRVLFVRRQFTRSRAIVMSLLKTTDETTILLSRGRIDRVPMIALLARFNGSYETLG